MDPTRLDLENALYEINEAIDVIKREHSEPFSARTPSGTYLLHDLLIAKTNLVVALAVLAEVR